MIKMDVVVQLLGFGGPNSSFQGQKQESGALRQAVASPTYLAKADRKLLTIVFTGGEQPNPSKSIARDVFNAVSTDDVDPGIICLVGESAGGKNVLAIANELSNPPVPITLSYVGIGDGAFFHADTVENPNWGATNLMIRGKPFSAKETVNIYQSAGNDTEIVFSSVSRMWSGKMPNKEIHGPIDNFVTNTDLVSDGRISATGKNISWEAVHTNAVSIANGIHLPRIRTLLDGAK